MFSYFGSKGRLADLYPAPAHRRVVEPFAGSARYSLLYWDREVWLNDLDPTIVDIWRYLQQATRREILALPELRQGEDLRNIKWLSPVERNLLGFTINRAQSSPASICTSWAAQENWIGQLKRTILWHSDHIKHWKVTCRAYADLPNERATWYIDPPYQGVPNGYRCGVPDYRHLAGWCRWRRGQVIVCEGEGANWLPFRFLANHRAVSGKMYAELVWTRDEVACLPEATCHENEAPFPEL
jgi:hypothetical protein